YRRDGRPGRGRGAPASPARPQPGAAPMKRDWAPHAVLPALILIALPAMGATNWLVLTVAGLAMGAMLFLMAAGLTLIFGLMDVLNFAHGAVIVAAPLIGWSGAESWGLNLAVFALAIAVAAAVSGAVGWGFERVIVRGVYGAPLRQILVTMGGLIVAQQLFIALWGADAIPLLKPKMFSGSIELGGAAIEKYRLLALALGLAVF